MALFRWLNTPSSVLRLVAGGTAWLFLLFFLSGIYSAAYYAAFGSSMMPDRRGMAQMSGNELIGSFAFSLCAAPFACMVEELISRAPLSMIGKIWPGSAMPLLAAILSSIFFGWLHGGWATVPYQGVCGLILSLYYLKAGGQEGTLFRPLSVSYLIHMGYNIALFGLGLVVSVAVAS